MWIFLFSILSFLVPTRAFALEVDYPDFIPLENVETLSGLISSLFTILLVSAGVVLFLAILYAGFQFIVGGANPALRQRARGRVKNAGVGIVVVLASFLVAQTINPDLIQPIPIQQREVVSAGPAPIFTPPTLLGTREGRAYTELALGRVLSANNTSLLNARAQIFNILDATEGLTAQCSTSLCTPPSIGYPQSTVETCTFKIINKNREEETVNYKCSMCTSNICAGIPAAASIPFPDRNAVQNAIKDARNILNELTFLTTEVNAANRAISACESNPSRTLLSCAAAVALNEDISCLQSDDFFCAIPSGETTRIERTTLPTTDIIEREAELSIKLGTIVNGTNGSSCSNVEFSCGSNACQRGGINERGSSGESGCPAALFARTSELENLRASLIRQRDTLSSTVSQINSLGELNSNNATERQSLLLCAEAQIKASQLLNDGTYPPTAFCGPDEAARQKIQSCAVTDFYLCR